MPRRDSLYIILAGICLADSVAFSLQHSFFHATCGLVAACTYAALARGGRR